MCSGRQAAAASVALAVILSVASVSSSPVHPDLENFKKRIRYEAVPGADAPSGVALDWSLLPGVLAQATRGMTLEISSTSVVEGGLGRAAWIWKGPANDLAVTVHVSGIGPRRAREKLLESASATMMVTIPYEAGPKGLGDLSIRNLGATLWHVFWVFQNVLVELDSEGGRTPIEPVARTIESLMESHIVERLSVHLPALIGFEASRSRVSVGQSMILHVRSSTPGESLLLDSREVDGHHFRFDGVAGLDQTYTAESVGSATFEARVADRRTLLSPALSPVIVEVLAPRSP
jgi:hypothetical protein